MDAARKIVLAGQKAETVVAVAENWSYHSLPRAVAKYVQDGNIGEVKNLFSRLLSVRLCIHVFFRRNTINCIPN